jgi:hypothetical protein
LRQRPSLAKRPVGEGLHRHLGVFQMKLTISANLAVYSNGPDIEVVCLSTLCKQLLSVVGCANGSAPLRTGRRLPPGQPQLFGCSVDLFARRIARKRIYPERRVGFFVTFFCDNSDRDGYIPVEPVTHLRT